jgi:hypothetical protein
MRITLIKLIAIFLFTSVCTNAQEKKPTNSPNITKKQVTYYDGKNELTIYLLEGYVAELGVESEKKSKVKSIDSSASSVRNIGYAQIFRVNDSAQYTSGKGLTKSLASGKYSAVYSRTGDEGSFVLPVGLIVSYKANTTELQISDLEKKYSLQKGKKLPLANLKFYSYEMESGQSALDIAANVRLESVVDSTSIDFVEERSVR